MREYDAHRPAPVAAEPPPGKDPEVAPAPMDLTVGEAILEAAELNSGLPDQRATEGGAAQSGLAGSGPGRAAEPVCRDDHGRATAGRNGAAGEVVRCHG
ncbi:hypothetical protein [Amycolatopsis vastitatis]|uniref:Uncharacterized protein n=1 Tax=Amycolatopsis vastitatis TaxID=1905142 RepID=A0A229TGY2_9PSEU|nr:hypothetical protein [Amycolatopsis vastitatis]OXM70506.1 hypothetical protein CF165_05420 [Amycolatopsis vastitatis]